MIQRNASGVGAASTTSANWAKAEGVWFSTVTRSRASRARNAPGSRAVAADTGSIGGTGSHEFHVLADSGEDAIAFCPTSDYAANVELAEALAPAAPRGAATAAMEKVATPGKTKCEDVAALLNIPLTKMVKAVAIVVKETAFHLVLLRGDHDLNEIKTQKLLGEFRFATDKEIFDALHCKAGYIGPVK